MQLELLIAGVRGDSVFGRAYAAFDPGPKDERPCGVLKGVRTGPARLSLVIFTSDDPKMDMIFEGKFRGDSLLVESARPRSGKNVLPWGSWLIFVRISSDTVSGCLTSA